MAVTISRGYQAKVGWTTEASYGTVPISTVFSWIGAVPEITPDLNVALIKAWTVGSRTLYQMQPGAREAGLSLTFHPQDVGFLSTILSTATMLPSSSLSLWTNYTDIAQSIFAKGCKVDSAKISGKFGELLECSYDLMAQDFVLGNSFGATLPTDPGTAIFFFANQSVSYSSPSVNGTLSKVWSFEVNIKNNLERVYQLGQVYIRALPEKNLEINGNLQMTFEDTSQFTDTLSANNFQMNIAIGPGHSITLSGCKWDKIDFPTKPTDLVVQTIPFTAQTISIS